MVMISTRAPSVSSQPSSDSPVAVQLANDLRLQMAYLRTLLLTEVSAEEKKSVGLQTLEQMDRNHRMLLETYQRIE